MSIYQSQPLVLLIVLLFLTAIPAHGQDEDVPQSPAEFHEQEWKRVKEGLFDNADLDVRSSQADFDVTYYELNLDLRNYAGRILSGWVTITARSLAPDLSEFVLDLCSAFIVDSVVSGGATQAFTLSANTLTASLDRVYSIDETASLTVYYHGTPCNTNLYQSFTYYSRSVNGNIIPAIHTLSEPYGARDWWPSKNVPSDKADSARISLTVADTLTATSVGVLESMTLLPPSSKTFTWFEKHPISTYLISANATNYRYYQDWYVSQIGDSVPIDHYTYPERYNLALISWSALPQMMQFFAQVYGEYPFADEKYGHSMFNFSGGMEHQCNTSYGRAITNGNHVYDYIVAHELAHQWWGDAVTLDTWPDIWLNEGFATYSEALWFEHLGGPAQYRLYMTNNTSVSDPSGPVYNPSALFSSNSVYHKGAWILHILRGAIRNDSLFFAIYPHYAAENYYSTATTTQYLESASLIAGFDVDPYLHTYLYRTNRPRFQVSFASGFLDSDTLTLVRILQTQTDPDTTFRTRLDLAFGGSHDTTVLVENSEWEQWYRLPLGYTPTILTVDPDNWALKQVTMTAMPLTIINTQLDSGSYNGEYADTLVAVGGTSPFFWNLAAGELPAGMTLWEDGVLSGIPVVYGHFPVTFLVLDSVGSTDTLTLMLDVSAPPIPAPWNLTARMVAADLLELRWGGSSPADSFRIYRATLGDFSDTLCIATIAQKSFTDTLASRIPGDTISVPARYYYVIAIGNP
jgi:aminopeptidase N